jgi:hypothetical protein
MLRVLGFIFKVWLLLAIGNMAVVAIVWRARRRFDGYAYAAFQRAVEEHAAPLKEMLRIKGCPIAVHPEYGESTNTVGLCTANIYHRWFHAEKAEPQQISLYAKALVDTVFTLSNALSMLRMAVTCTLLPGRARKLIYEKAIHTLAHEVRHAWQYESGAYIANTTNFTAVNVDFTPYKDRWEEIDADAWADRYMERIKGGNVDARR